MKDRGWNLNSLQFPSCVHLCVTNIHTEDGTTERFIKDVTEIAAEMIEQPGPVDSGAAALYGMATTIPDRNLVGKLTWCYLDSLYAEKPKIPMKE